jgi:hypothetical protein
MYCSAFKAIETLPESGLAAARIFAWERSQPDWHALCYILSGLPSGQARTGRVWKGSSWK